jgi:DNA-binding transcriptional MerR regulator
MDDDGSPLLTIGQLASRTGLAVRTIRYWSDIGAVPPAGRSSGGHRLYDAESVARLDLVRTLRELGLGLEEVRRVLAREATVADVAAAHVAALDAQIRSLRLTRAVLSVVARRDPGTEEMTLMNKLARLSAAERRQIIDDFIAELFSGLDADPKLKEKLQLTVPELPDEPTPEQVDAWVELAELVQDPQFRQRMRKMVEYHAGDGPAPQAGTLQRFTQKITALVGPARERGIAPDSPEAGQVVARMLDGADVARRAYVRERLEAGVDSQSDRYHELLAVINGEQARPARAPDLKWLMAAIDSHPA